MKVLGVIPARANSKSIKGKNVVPLCGKPLIQYTIEAACESTWLNEIVVTTDCPKVKEIASNFDVKVIDRPERLAMDDTPMVPVLQHAVIESGGAFDAVMLLQPTCPLRRKDEIDGAVVHMLSTRVYGCTSVISYVDVGANHPARMVVMLKSGYPHSFWTVGDDDRFANKQDLPSVYLRSGDIYLVTTECLMRGDLLGSTPRAYMIRPERFCNIDCERDLLWAEFLLSREASEWKTKHLPAVLVDCTTQGEVRVVRDTDNYVGRLGLP